MLRVYRELSDLPATLPVFPLGGAILFPRALLPLNIFEPRYLAMVDAALSGERLIGMIQPAGQAALATDMPLLASVGCAGRITGYQETEDGRYLIVLTGVCRFRVREELRQAAPYRLISPDWTAFAGDLAGEAALGEGARMRLVDALRSYLERGAMKADWSAVEEAPLETLVNSLSAGCPFTNPEKQALLEARTPEDRCAALISLLEMDRPGQGGGYLQ